MKDGSTIFLLAAGAYHGTVNFGIEEGKYVGKYYDAPVYELSIFNDGSAITTPPDGIWVGIGVYKSSEPYNRTLMGHEYGHWLQYEEKGFGYYYTVIAPANLYFAITRNSFGWTELDASNRGYNFLNQPAWWDLPNFPLHKLHK